MTYKIKEETEKYIFLPGFILIASSIIIKCFYGVGWNDEAYYIVLAQRFAKGDILLYHDWYPTQWSGIILAPLFVIYHSITGGTEGIILFFRLFWSVFTILESLLIWWFIKKISDKDLYAFLSAVFLLIYSTENKALYSYSDMSVHFLILVILSLWMASEHKNKWLVFVAGIPMALTVICNPYTLIVYIWFILAEIIYAIRNKKSLINWLIFTIGALALGLPIVIYTLVNAPLNDVLKGLNYMLSMPDHPAKNLLIATLKWVWYLLKSYTIVGIAVQLVIVLYILRGLIKDSLTDVIRNVVFHLELLLSVVYVVVQYTLMDDKYVIGVAYVPLSLTAIVLYLLCKKRDKRQLLLVIIPGLLLSLAFQWGSDTGIYAMMTGTAVSVIITPIIFGNFLQEMESKNIKSTYAFTYTIFMLAFLYTFGQRLIYSRPGIYEKEYNVRVNSGVYKGILTDEKQRDYLLKTKDSIAEIADNTSDEDNVLVLGSADNCWIYLETDRGIGSFFAFRVDSDHPYFEPYYDMHPEKIPEYIYANEFSKEYESDTITVAGKKYVMTDNSNCYKLRTNN